MNVRYVFVGVTSLGWWGLVFGGLVRVMKDGREKGWLLGQPGCWDASVTN